MLRRLVNRFRRHQDHPPDDAPPPRDYVHERDAHRHDQLSEEDRAWEAASQQRNRDRQAQDQPPPVE